MDLQGLFEYLAEEWAVVSHAPSIFISGAVLVATVTYGFARLQLGQQINTLRERISLRDDRIADYKAKLEGASPDEAARKLSALEQEIAILKSTQPWMLDDGQVKRLSQCIADKPSGVQIIRNVASARLEVLQDQLIAVFQSAKWAVHHWPTGDTPVPPNLAVTLCVSEKQNAETISIIRDAFRTAEVEFGEQEAGPDDTIPVIFISAPHP